MPPIAQSANITLSAHRKGGIKLENSADVIYECIFREAMELASQAMQASKFEDWYWKVQMGKCYFRLGMFRDSEKMFKSALKQQEMIDTFLLLAKVYIR